MFAALMLYLAMMYHPEPRLIYKPPGKSKGKEVIDKPYFS
jgi:hypothetical protein